MKKELEAKKLFFTWWDYFAENIWDIWATNIIEYSINLKPRAYLVQEKIPHYNAKKRIFATGIFSLMEEVGIIV